MNVGDLGDYVRSLDEVLPKKTHKRLAVNRCQGSSVVSWRLGWLLGDRVLRALSPRSAEEESNDHTDSQAQSQENDA